MSVKSRAQQRCSWLPEVGRHSGPVYLALVEEIARAVANGQLPVGERLPPQRLLADALGVTVGTITRAYREAERRGLVEAKVGSGTRVKGSQADIPSFSHLSRATADSIDLSLSIPIPHLNRQQQFSAVLQRLANQPSSLDAALLYQAEQGHPEHRQRLANWLATQGVAVDWQELVFTEGGQHADYLAMQALIKPGEAVASAALTYPGMIAVARQLSLKHVPIATDEQGIRPEALDRACQRQRIRMLYVMPEFNNPTGEHMSDDRRRAIVEVARRHDILIIEDAVQWVSAESRGQPFFHLAPERSLFIFSVSKLLAGGLRFGVLRVPPAILGKVMTGLRAQCWATAGLLSDAAIEWLTSGISDSLIEWQSEEVKRRHEILAEHLSDYQLKYHPCSFHSWLILPEPWRAKEFVEAAAQVGVTLIDSEPFCVGSQPAPQAVRICVTPPTDREHIAIAAKRLAELLNEGPSHNALPL